MNEIIIYLLFIYLFVKSFSVFVIHVSINQSINQSIRCLINIYMTLPPIFRKRTRFWLTLHTGWRRLWKLRNTKDRNSFTWWRLVSLTLSQTGLIPDFSTGNESVLEKTCSDHGNSENEEGKPEGSDFLATWLQEKEPNVLIFSSVRV